MKIEEKHLKHFDSHNAHGSEFLSFLLSDSQIEGLESVEELEEALRDMRFHLCELVSRERELVYAKEQFLRCIAILDTQFVLMQDK